MSAPHLPSGFCGEPLGDPFDWPDYSQAMKRALLRKRAAVIAVNASLHELVLAEREIADVRADGDVMADGRPDWAKVAS